MVKLKWLLVVTVKRGKTSYLVDILRNTKYHLLQLTKQKKRNKRVTIKICMSDTISVLMALNQGMVPRSLGDNSS